MQHKEQQKTSHFKLDRTKNCHEVNTATTLHYIEQCLLVPMRYTVHDNKHQRHHAHTFSLFSSPPTPGGRKEGIENYCCADASMILRISLFLPPKITEWLRWEVTSGSYLVQPPAQAVTPSSGCPETWWREGELKKNI